MSPTYWLPCLTALLISTLAGGCGTPSFLVTPVSSSTKLLEEEVQPGKGKGKIAIIPVEGMLMNVRTGGFMQASENTVSLFEQQMAKAAADAEVKAVVLRVNSPGGTVTASDLMFETITQFREKTKKPVIASTQETAASGGYYVACAADQVVVHPTSVVGSIGVIFSTFEFAELMQKVGVKSQAIKSGPLKDMGSPFKALGDDERAVMQGMVDAYYARFVELVKTRRGLSDEATIKLVTDGRVFTGADAVKHGLADRTGSLDDALDLARELGKSPNAKAVIFKRPFGYGGSIYASTEIPSPQMNNRPTDTMRLELPGTPKVLPGGFYYVWPGGL